jgi:hypothetical protein
MKLPSKSHSLELLTAYGWIKSAHRRKTRLTYWKEALDAYKKEAVGVIFPVVAEWSAIELSLLAEYVLSKNNATTKEFIHQVSLGFLAFPVIMQWWPNLVPEGIQPKSERIEVNGPWNRNLALATAFGGKGLKYAVARFLAPPFVSPSIECNINFTLFPDFVDVFLRSSPKRYDELYEIVKADFSEHVHLIPEKPSYRGDKEILIPSKEIII